MYKYEKTCFENGFVHIAGVDEAGRGPLAGPVVASAVILNPHVEIPGLNDSKQLSKQKRDRLFDEILANALSYAIAFVYPEEIDRINIYQASKKAMIEAIKQLSITPDFILTDAMPLKELTIPSLPIIKGDTLSASIAAGSILAKVSRDRYMEEMAKKYPSYGFDRHKGYPTKDHLDAIQLFGITPIHRKTYKPVKDILQKQIAFDL